VKRASQSWTGMEGSASGHAPNDLEAARRRSSWIRSNNFDVLQHYKKSAMRRTVMQQEEVVLCLVHGI